MQFLTKDIKCVVLLLTQRMHDCVDYDSQLKLLVLVRGLSGVQFRV